MSQTDNPNSIFNTVVVPGAMTAILAALVGFLVWRDARKPEPSPADQPASAASSECAGYDKTPEEVRADVDAGLERWSYNAGLNVIKGTPQYRDEMARSVEEMKTTVETARRCAGYSDFQINLTPEVLGIIGVEPKPKRGKP